MGIATRGQILKDSSKYLFFRNTATTYTCYPVNNFVGFTEKGTSSTTLIMYFIPQDRMDSTYYDYIELTVTNHEDAIRDIMDAINFSKQTVITVADNVDEDYISGNISSTDGMNGSTTTSQA